MADEARLRVPRKGYRLFRTKSWAVFIEGLWHNNPIFGMILSPAGEAERIDMPATRDRVRRATGQTSKEVKP